MAAELAVELAVELAARCMLALAIADHLETKQPQRGPSARSLPNSSNFGDSMMLRDLNGVSDASVFSEAPK